MPNYRLDLCYDGSRYMGWQRLAKQERTIQGTLERTLSQLLGQEIEVSGAGRTDAGVHARGQVASFRAHTDMPPEAILAGLRHYLPQDIGAMRLEIAPARFHARLSCTGKHYLYRLWYSDTPCVFERKYVYVHPPDQGILDISAMRAAADQLLGERDFAAFHTGHTKKSTVRRLDQLDVSQVGPELQMLFHGNGFLYHMVRILAGTLVDVGLGRLRVEAIPEIFERGERAQAGRTLPACGLCLLHCDYPD